MNMLVIVCNLSLTLISVQLLLLLLPSCPPVLPLWVIHLQLRPWRLRPSTLPWSLHLVVRCVGSVSVLQDQNCSSVKVCYHFLTEFLIMIIIISSVFFTGPVTLKAVCSYANYELFRYALKWSTLCIIICEISNSILIY